MNDQETLENKKMLISIMQEENELLDRILEQQSILHECVKEKNWEKLNFNIEKLIIIIVGFAF